MAAVDAMRGDNRMNKIFKFFTNTPLWVSFGLILALALNVDHAYAGTFGGVNYKTQSVDVVGNVDGRLMISDYDFPRLLAMSIADDSVKRAEVRQVLAKFNIVILGFVPGWNAANSSTSYSDVLKKLKALNPRMLVGIYTVLNEAQGDVPKYIAVRDKAFKIEGENWWLKTSNGDRRQWTKLYDAYDINITTWTPPDFNGMRYPEWLAERDYRIFFKTTPEFDIWYFDNVMSKQRVDKADWDLDGKDDNGSEPRIQQAFRQGQAAHWSRARKLAPSVLFMGNPDNDLSFPEYKDRLQGAFLEGLMGRSWSIEKRMGWGKMMDHYHAVFHNLLEPKMVGFNVHGSVDDYRFFRYAYASSLMDDGYFSFTDEKSGYSRVPLFDEYNVKLGRSIDPAQLTAWKGDVYRRRFENGMVLVNPSGQDKRVVVEAGYRRFTGKQAPDVNNGEPVSDLLIPAKDGIVLIKNR